MGRRTKGRKIALLAGCGVAVVLYVFFRLHWGEIRFWYLLGAEFESVGKNSQGYQEYRHRRTGINAMDVYGGGTATQIGLSGKE